MKSTTLSLTLKVETRENYATQTILQREINVTVAPGVDPMEELNRLITKEFHATKLYCDQFPLQALLPAPDEA